MTIGVKKMSKRKSTNNFSTILSSIIILLLVIGVVGFLFIRTENFTTTLKDFYVRVGNDDIIADRENFDIVVGKEYKFEIVDNYMSTPLEVSVVPNTDIEESLFDFYVNKVYHQFCYEDSLTSGFEIKAYKDYFTFTANKDLSDIIQLNYPDRTITNCPTAIDSGVPYFRLVVASQDGMQEININFNLKSE